MSETTRPSDIAVIGGAGHVGLPLSLRLADDGRHVTIVDISQPALDSIASGQMPFLENGADELLERVLPTGRLSLASAASAVEGIPVVIVVIGTPIDKFMNPSTHAIDQVVEDLAPHLGEDALIILRSTVFPGTTEHVRGRLDALGCNVRIAFCPERIAEGHALEELSTLPQVIGADDPETLAQASAVFASMGAQTVAVSTAEAEFSKLFTNAWRYMKFAVANQFFMIANEAGVDYDNVLHAIRHDYPRAADLPGPGFAAGPCLLKDTMQLAAFTPDSFPMGQSARQINEGLPAYVVSVLQRRFDDLHGLRIGILGMAFKAESDDPRDSLSFKLRNLLTWAGAIVISTDPYVDDDSLRPLDDVIAESDVLVVGAPHKAYRGTDFGDTPLIDVWGITEAGISL